MDKCPKCGGEFMGDACPKCLAGFAREGLSRVADEMLAKAPTVIDGTRGAGDLALGSTFKGLEILQKIGAGGMGVVYKARQPALNRLVALKVLKGDLARGPEFAGRFSREAQALATLSHPNIVAIHDFGRENDLFYIVMEYVDGVNLRQILAENKLKPEEALTIVPQLCDALEYAHGEGVIHRDIKPENILMDKKGRIKISDFGLAKMIPANGKPEAITRANAVMGTPHYMAPEQVESPQSVDHRADIYSMGVVFYEMLTGELPLGKFAPPSRKVEIDVRLDEVVLKTLEKEPLHRYQRASQVKEDVTHITAAANPVLARRWSRWPEAGVALLFTLTTIVGFQFLAVYLALEFQTLSDGSLVALHKINVLWFIALFLMIGLSGIGYAILKSYWIRKKNEVTDLSRSSSRVALLLSLICYAPYLETYRDFVWLPWAPVLDVASFFAGEAAWLFIFFSLIEARRCKLRLYRPLVSWLLLAILTGSNLDTLISLRKINAPATVENSSAQKQGEDVSLLSGGPQQEGRRTGSIKGVVSLKWTKPPEVSEDHPKPKLSCPLHPESLVRKTFVTKAVRGEERLQGVFVWIKDIREGYPPPTEPVWLSVCACRFEPRVVGVLACQKLNVQNLDARMLNIHGLPRVNKEFNYAIPSNSPITLTFNVPEMGILLRSAFDPFQHGYLFVMSHPFFSTTDEEGAYRIPNLPFGRYILMAWHEEVLQAKEFPIEVSEESPEVDHDFVVESNP